MPLTLSGLFGLMKQFENPVSKTGRDPNSYKNMKLYTLEYTGWVTMASLLFKSEVQSDSKSPKRRLVSLIFYNLTTSESQTSSHPFRVKIDNNFFHFSLPTINTRCAMRCQCFTGDTPIILADGSSVRIDSLVGKKEFFVKSFDIKTNRNVIGRGHSAKNTGKKPVYKVTFDNGASIKCTNDHKFLLHSGIYKEVKDIFPGEVLKSLDKERKIVSLEYVGEENVFCFTVDDYHNYAIDTKNRYNVPSGVFVHNCEDFFFRFSRPLYNNQALIGPPATYVRKTTTRPSMNPNQSPGVCRHLWALIKKLEDSRVLL